MRRLLIAVGLLVSFAPSLAAERQYWILMGYYENDHGFERVPRALGPYPTRELCRLAGKSVVPDDRKFWTAAERLAADALMKKEADKRAAYLKTAKRGKVLNGVESSWTSATQYVTGGSLPPVAITGCLVQE